VKNGNVKDLLQVTFCRTMIALSNAAFNHQSMSFKSSAETPAFPFFEKTSSQFILQFRNDASIIEKSMLDNPIANAQIELADSRSFDLFALKNKARFDLVITSPPYPNRMSYIRELRPYMYWLNFLNDSKEAGELDWQAIGGTWGIATSRLLKWKPSDAFIPAYLKRIITAIQESHPVNGELMAKYVHKYFDDMFHHFQNVFTMMRPKGTVHYIIGNSVFYGHLVPAEQIYVDQLKKIGFRNTNLEMLRKRNSKKELVEFHAQGER
jgi:hypothetical protein